MLFSGLVKDLKNVKIVQIALGKAHAIALSVKGHVYSFGINNKGQCGRDICNPQVNKNSKYSTIYFLYLYLLTIVNHVVVYNSVIDYSDVTNIEPVNQINSANEQGIFDEDCDDNKPNEDICKRGQHNWKHAVCMVCTVCGECTGYSISCLSSIRSNRKAGQ